MKLNLKLKFTVQSEGWRISIVGIQVRDVREVREIHDELRMLECLNWVSASCMNGHSIPGFVSPTSLATFHPPDEQLTCHLANLRYSIVESGIVTSLDNPKPTNHGRK